MFDIKNRKIQILITFLLLSAASFFYLFYATQKAKRVSNQPLVETNSSIDNPVDGKIIIESALKKERVSIPSKIFVYSLSVSAAPATQFYSLATKLGFKTQPIVLKDVNYGNVYYWSAQNASLQITPSENLIEFGITIDHLPNATFLSDEKLIQAADKFLKETLPDNVIGQFVSLNFTNNSFESYTIVPKAEAELAEIRFVQKIDGLPIVNESIEVGTINTKVAKNGSVVFVYAEFVNSTTGQKEVNLMDFDKLVDSLKQARLQSLDNGKIDILNVSASNIEKIIIEDAHLAYYKASSRRTDLLQPIFVLNGKATLKDQRIVDSLLYLPAAK